MPSAMEECREPSGNCWGISHCLENLEMSEFDSCQRNFRDFTKSHGNVNEKILSGKSGLKLFIVSYCYCCYLFHPEDLEKGEGDSH